MMEVGGYFHLELNKICNFSHYDGILLNSGRCSFEYILVQLSVKKVFLPFYTCEVVLEPILRRGIKYEFYNRFEIVWNLVMEIMCYIPIILE